MPTYDNWQPFNFVDNGKPQGYLIDLACLIAEKLNVNIEFVQGYPWADHMKMLKAGGLDLVGNMVKTAEREKAYLFSDKTTFKLMTGLVSLKGHTRISQLGDGMLGVMQDSVFEKFLAKHHPRQKTIRYSKMNDLITGLVNREIDAFIENYSVVSYLFNTVPLFEKNITIKMLDDEHSPELFMHFAVSRNEPLLISSLNKAYNSIPPEKLKSLLVKWDTTMSLPTLPLTSEEQAYLQNNPVLTLGYALGFEPFLIEKSPNEYTGIVPDIYALIAQRLGITLRFEIGDWKTTIQKLHDGKIDVIPLMDSRTALLHNTLISEEVFEILTQVYAPKETDIPLNSIEDLHHLRVAFTQNILVLDRFLSQYQNTMDLVRVPTILDAFALLENNKADAVVSLNTGNFLLAKHFLSDIEPVFTIKGITIKSVSAIRPDAPILRDILDKAIHSLSIKEKYAISDKWLGMHREHHLTDEEEAWIQSNPTIKVGVHEIPPYIIFENNKVKGYYAGIFQEVLNTAGLKAEYSSPLPVGNVLEGMKRGQFDVALAMVVSPEREKYIDFSNHHQTLNVAIFAGADAGDITDLASLRTKTVATYSGCGLNGFIAENFDPAAIITGGDASEMMQLVENGKADACFQEQHSGEYIIYKNNLHGLKAKGFLTSPDKGQAKAAIWGVQKKNPILKSILDKSYGTIGYSKLEKLRRKWFLSEDDKSRRLSVAQTAYLQNNTFNIYVNNWEPFSILANSSDEKLKVQGLSVDFWRALVQDLGVQYNFIKVDTCEQLLERIKKDPNALTIAAGKTEELEHHGVFSEIYDSYPIAIMTRLDAPFERSMNHLKGKRIAVSHNSTVRRMLEKYYPDIILIPVNNTLEALDLTARKQVYAAADLLPVLNFISRKYNYDHLKISSLSKQNFDLYIFANNNSKKLIYILNRMMPTLAPETITDIKHKWGHGPVKERINYRYVLAALALILVILLWYYQRSRLLKMKNKELEAIFATSQHGIALVDLKANFLYANEAYLDMLQYRMDELLKLNCIDLSIQPEQETIQKVFAELPHKQIITDLEKRCLTKNGETLIASMSLAMMPDKQRILLSAKDITADVTVREDLLRKNNELTEIKEELERARQLANLGIWEFDIINDSLIWSDETFKIFELDRESFTPSYGTFMEKIHPDDRHRVATAYENAFLSREKYKLTHRILTGSGRIKWVEEQGGVEFDPIGKPLVSMGTIYDITVQKRQKKNLKRP